jgi:type II secretory pathway component PulJ
MRVPARTERGVSLIEVVLTMTLFLAVSGAIFGVFDVVTGAHRRQDASLEARQAVRVALDQIAVDLRLGRRVIIASPADASTELVVRGPETGTHLVGFRNLPDGGLLRVTKTGERMLLPGRMESEAGSDTADMTPAEPGGWGEGPPAATFRYLDDRGRELDPRVEDRETLERCTAAVRVELRRTVAGSSTTVEATRTVALRNRDRSLSC